MSEGLLGRENTLLNQRDNYSSHFFTVTSGESAWGGGGNLMNTGPRDCQGQLG